MEVIASSCCAITLFQGGLRGRQKKHEDLNQIRSRSHLYSVVKLVSQGQGTITADTAHTILGRRLLISRYAYHSNPLPVH